MQHVDTFFTETWSHWPCVHIDEHYQWTMSSLKGDQRCSFFDMEWLQKGEAFSKTDRSAPPLAMPPAWTIQLCKGDGGFEATLWCLAPGLAWSYCNSFLHTSTLMLLLWRTWLTLIYFYINAFFCHCSELSSFIGLCAYWTEILLDYLVNYWSNVIFMGCTVIELFAILIWMCYAYLLLSLYRQIHFHHIVIPFFRVCCIGGFCLYC